jgi:hypothetical protein
VVAERVGREVDVAVGTGTQAYVTFATVVVDDVPRATPAGVVTEVVKVTEKASVRVPLGAVKEVSMIWDSPLMMNVDHVGRFANSVVSTAPKLPPLATMLPPRLTEYDPTPLPQHRPSLPASTIVKFSVSPATPQYDGSTPFDADEPLSNTRRPGPIIGSGGAVMVHDTSVGALSATNVTAMV